MEVRRIYSSYKAYAKEKAHNLSKKYIPSLTNYGWIKYMILMWSIRMSFLAVAMIFPLLASLSSSYESDKINYNISINEWDVKDESIPQAVLTYGIPALILNVPVVNQNKV